MTTPTRSQLPPGLHDLAAMASLLERLDARPRSARAVSADQYRHVVERVRTLLAQAEPGPMLDALLAAAPSTAELYENLQYAHAGLVRSPLDPALAAEQAAVAAIARARAAR